ncbi:MAG: chromosome partitioning protein ParB [Micavibrio sp.]|nr:MAG: chromosome partitioning protein ParB [Micavibrio sp.]
MITEEKTREESKDLNPKKRGLGRGLNALFDDDESPAAPVKTAASAPTDEASEENSDSAQARKMIGIDKVQPNPHQPRRVLDMAAIEELSASIKEHGVLQPLLVRRSPNNEGYYEIIAGERRWRASQRAQRHEVPVIVLDLDDAQAYEIALIENLQREDLNPMDEAVGYQKMLEEYKYTQDQLAQKIGKSRSHIANMVRLTGLTDLVQAHLSDGTITIGHARALIKTKNPDELVKKIVSQGLSVRQTERLAAEDNPLGPKKSSGPRARSQQGKDVDTLALEKEVSNALGMNVSIDGSGQSGTLKIAFKSLDQLDEVLHRLSHFPGSRLSG